jgi:hypothetical protein
MARPRNIGVERLNEHYSDEGRGMLIFWVVSLFHGGRLARASAALLAGWG